MEPMRRESSTGWWLAFWAAFAAALLFRLVDLGVRPLHHDEGVNAWMVWKFLRGEPYRYDPHNFHGPFLFFYAWLPLRLFAPTDTLLRLLVAPVSALMVPLLLPLRRRLGVAGITGAAWLLAVSPSFVFYGRDLIHETFLAFFTLAMIVCGSLYAETRRERWLLAAAVCLGLLPTIKETFVLTLATLAVAGLLAWFWIDRRPGEDPVTPVWIAPRTLALAVVLAAAVYVLFFSSFFTNLRGLVDSLRGLLLWTKRGVGGDGHQKPWYYFPELLAKFEPAIAFGALAGGWLALRRRDGFGVLCAFWAAGQLVLYSAIPYKTPWLVLNLLVPAVLVGGVFCRELAKAPWRRVALPALLAFLLVGTGFSVWRAVQTSFLRYDDDSLMIVYVPTMREVRGLVAQVEEEMGRVPPGRRGRLRIYLPYSWPLSWYFRDIPGLGVWNEVPDKPDGDVLIVEGSQEPKLKSLLRQRYARRDSMLRPRTPIVLYVKERPRG
jgi:uncharacterized protein (TIGR03663 family)